MKTVGSPALTRLPAGRFRSIVLGSVILASASFGQTASLTVKCDLECEVRANGKALGTAKAGGAVRRDLPAGEYRVEAAAVGKDDTAWSRLVDIRDAEPVELEAPLLAVVQANEARQRGYWTDPSTGLLWAVADNGSAISWNQAGNYCRSLVIGGRDGWRLAGIDELQRIFGGPASERGFRVRGPLRLTGWAWSRTPGKEPGEAWALDFGDGARASVVAGDAGLNRALCVRPPG